MVLQTLMWCPFILFRRPDEPIATKLTRFPTIILINEIDFESKLRERFSLEKKSEKLSPYAKLKT